MNATIVNGQHRLLAQMATLPACQRNGGEADWFPPVDILEDSEEYLFRIDLPGTRPEDVHVVVEEDGLFISGDRAELPPGDKKWLRVERPHGHFERRFALPDDASRAEVSSAFEQSVLELRVRKVTSVMPIPAPTGAWPSPLVPTPPPAGTPPRLRLRSVS